MDKRDINLERRVANALFNFSIDNTGITPAGDFRFEALVIILMIKYGLAKSTAEKEVEQLLNPKEGK